LRLTQRLGKITVFGRALSTHGQLSIAPPEFPGMPLTEAIDIIYCIVSQPVGGNFDFLNKTEPLSWKDAGKYDSVRQSENGYFPQSIGRVQIIILRIIYSFLRVIFAPSFALEKLNLFKTAPLDNDLA